MKKPACFFLLLIMLSPFTACDQQGGDNETSTTTSAAATTTAVAHADFFYNDFDPATGRGEAPQSAHGIGPWSARIKLAASPDGLKFTATAESVVDQGGVPNAIVDHEGYTRIYYVAWQGKGNMNGNDGNFMAFAIKNPTDGKWFFHRLVLDKTYGSNAVDPSVVLLPGGGYRLYYMANEGNMQQQLRIFSATSDDGLSFHVDDGARIIPTGLNGIYDPMVLQTGSTWLIVTGPDGSYSATSTDGLLFTEPKQFEVGGKPFHAWAGVALPKGTGYRLYGYFPGLPGGLTSVSSTDGVSWVADEGTGLTGGTANDVGVAVLTDGTFLMSYLEEIQD
ncbi:MAG: hypothetical protein WCQ99_12695 [Pseudomonadota bacterium]